MQRLPEGNGEEDSASASATATASAAPLYAGPLPRLQPLDAADALRRKRRADLMLDDACLATAAMDCRATVPARVYAFYALSVLTLGVVAVVAQWPFCRLRAVRATSRACAPEEADCVIVHGEEPGSFEVCEVEGLAVKALEALGAAEGAARRSAAAAALGGPLERRMIVYRHTRFLLRAAPGGGGGWAFTQLQADEAEAPAAGGAASGLGEAEAAARLAAFGPNLIDVPIPPIATLLLRECVHPFIVFQLWAVLVWVSEAYYSFSAFILCAALATAGTNLVDLLHNLREIRRLSLYAAPVTVLREGGRVHTLDSAQLVPGDVLLLAGAQRVPADCALLEGAVSVTEAMLTGEATVVTKVRLPQPSGNLAAALPAATTRSTLFAGTAIVAVRGEASSGSSGGSSGGGVSGARALVLRTGFDTVKGRLVLSILYPSGPAFKFLEESLRFIAILFALALVGFAVNARALASFGAGWGTILQRGADMVTIVVPPALPLAVTVGTLYALVALRKAGISCISPGKVNVAGKVNAFCFDKTGTLTAESLVLQCVRPAAWGAFAAEAGAGSDAHVRHPHQLQQQQQQQQQQQPQPQQRSPSALTWLLATCHSLLTLEGALAGDPLEVEVFQALPGARLGVAQGGAAAAGCQEPHTVVTLGGGGSGSGSEAAAPAHVLHVFDFSAQLARMGTLVELPAGASQAVAAELGLEAPSAAAWSFVKGAPEVLAALCLPASLPPDFAEVLAGYARRGLRVLGAAAAPYAGALPGRDAGEEEGAALRSAAEAGLVFLGLVVLENRLKPQSAPVISQLKVQTGMPLVMVTGDNAISAIAVSRQCGLLEPGERVFLGDCAPLPRGAAAPAASSTSGSASPQPPLRIVWEDSDRLDPMAASPRVPSGAGTPLPWPSAEHRAGDLCSDTLLPFAPIDSAGTTASLGASARPPGAYRLAMTGRAFMAMLASVKEGTLPLAHLQRAVLNCAVFARMAPEAKGALVQCLQGTGLYVGMIGDGANDAMALKAAHVGISLSTVEASVAAPFTSAVPTIEAIPLVLAEGRGALATSFCLFQFMALYSTIQFANALIAVHSASFLSNNMYLYQDLWVVLVLALTLGSTPSARRLGRKRPSGRLFSAYNLTITLVFIATTFAMQLAAVGAVQRTPWYGSAGYPLAMAPGSDPEGTNSAIPETTSLFIVASYQFIGCAAIFSVGHPWKQWPTANLAFCAWLGVVALSTLGLTLAPSDAAYSALSLQRPPYSWSWSLLGLGLLACASYFAALGGVYYAKGRGWLAALECRPPPKAHKVLRRQWEEQWRSGALAPALHIGV